MNAWKKSVLLLIDVQQSFEHKPYWQTDDLPAFQDRLLALIAGAKARNVPIVNIMHVDPDGAFALASGWVKPMAFLPSDHDAAFLKSAHNSFSTTGLQRWLVERDINHLIISGIRTEQCCETTTRVAADLGYAVDYVTEATLTFPMTHPVSGRRYSTAELKEKTELVLHNRFARIVTVEECLRGLDD